MSEPVNEIVDLPSAEGRARQPRPRFGGRALIVCDNLVKIYKVADLEVVALQGLDLLVESGEFIALVGASGSGKSTLLNILGGLDVPSAGRVVVAGHELAAMGSTEQTRYLRHVIGFVWQQTVAQPPAVPDGARERRAADGLRRRVGRDARRARARAAGRRSAWPTAPAIDRTRLSGGEQQRVAIAVALANRPEVLLADEPTGELDTANAHQIFDLFRRLNTSLGVTIVVATHDPLGERPGRPDGRDPRRAESAARCCASRPISAEGDHQCRRPRSTRCSTGPVGCSCRAPMSRRSGSPGAFDSSSRATTSASGRTTIRAEAPTRPASDAAARPARDTTADEPMSDA